ncbi:hypothetical protein SUT007_18780 [Streptococcus parasuis]|nr:hypothetical protein SUT007_18780 [Streptococcus parasuis]
MGEVFKRTSHIVIARVIRDVKSIKKNTIYIIMNCSIRKIMRESLMIAIELENHTIVFQKRQLQKL